MSDLNKEALDVWGALKPMIDQEISSRTQGMVQRRKAKVTTAPSLATNTIGVTEAFGQEIFLPFVSNMISAKVGDFVWIEWMYGATNAFVSSFAAVDDKNFAVAGTLDVVQRRCYATLSSAGWYRVMCLNAPNTAIPVGDVSWTVDFEILDWARQSHRITLYGLLGTGYPKFNNEVSATTVSYFDKIRYTTIGNNGYVDVHYTGTSQRYQACWFTVHNGWQTTSSATFSPAEMQSFFTPVNFTAVVDSPSGETVLTEYVFAANTNVARTYFTPTFSGTANPSVSNASCYYSIKDGVMYAGGRFNIASFTSGSTTVLFTLPVSLGIADRGAETIGTAFTASKTLQLRSYGAEVYITDAGGNYSGGLLNTGYWSFQIVAPIYN